MKKNVTLIRLMVSYLFLVNIAYATIWYVHPDSALNTIQAGLDSCANNDIVLVAPGTYYENVVWPNTQGIHLISEFGPDTTIIDGDQNGTVIYMPSADSGTIISGFTIRNGLAWLGGGIYCVAGGAPMITNNIITDNTVTGGSKSIYAGHKPLLAPLFSKDMHSLYGPPPLGAGICWDFSSPVIIDNIIAANNGAYGSGIAGLGHAPGIAPRIIGNTITANTGTAGGGIYIECFEESLQIASNAITLNESIYGGGIFFNFATSSVIVASNIITNNSADSLGGGIYCQWASSPTIDSCTIADNVGDGIYCCDSSMPILFHNNIVDNAGYAIRNTDPLVMIDAENNWWGDATGPYHSTLNPGGLGDSVSDYVDFNPWLTAPVGIEEQPIVKPVEKHETLGTTIFSGPLLLPKDKKCKVFDITGRVVIPDKIKSGIYFIEVDGEIRQKVVKVR
jgi:parallel beta-helix repeat protein